MVSVRKVSTSADRIFHFSRVADDWKEFEVSKGIDNGSSHHYYDMY